MCVTVEEYLTSQGVPQELLDSLSVMLPESKELQKCHSDLSEVLDGPDLLGQIQLSGQMLYVLEKLRLDNAAVYVGAQVPKDQVNQVKKVLKDKGITQGVLIQLLYAHISGTGDIPFPVPQSDPEVP